MSLRPLIWTSWRLGSKWNYRHVPWQLCNQDVFPQISSFFLSSSRLFLDIYQTLIKRLFFVVSFQIEIEKRDGWYICTFLPKGSWTIGVPVLRLSVSYHSFFKTVFSQEIIEKEGGSVVHMHTISGICHFELEFPSVLPESQAGGLLSIWGNKFEKRLDKNFACFVRMSWEFHTFIRLVSKTDKSCSFR